MQPTRMRRLVLSLLLLLLAACATSRPKTGTAYVNGLWFDGHGFVPRTMYVAKATLHVRAPRTIERTVDLAGKFVIPPLAEGHNHWLEADKIAEYNQRYLHDGVFYVMDQANVPATAARVRAATNKPDAVDYRVAILGWTAPGGHPLEILHQFVKMGQFPATWTTDAAIDKHGVMIVTSEREIDERWPLFRAAHSDFVKVFMDASGLDPKIVPHIVQLAHADGLFVSAHIYTAADFRNALRAGVDLIAHMPGTGAADAKDLAPYLITDADAAEAARRNVPVMTTLGWLNDSAEEDAARAQRIQSEVIAPNVAKLRAHGVRMLIGSDQFRETPVGELLILARLGVPNAEILRIATMDTPRFIFPHRRIGALEDDAEASFLALEKNPLVDIANVKSIALRVKQGVTLVE
jgi:hypothetical protein